jgi:hypothetical protein
LFAKRGNPPYGPSSRCGRAVDICASKHAINKRRRFFTGIIVFHQDAANVALVIVPAAVQEAFIKANPGLSASSMAVEYHTKRLTGVRI